MNLPALTGIISIIFGVIYGIQAYNLPRANVGNPIAPILFPLLLSVFMIICGIVLFIKETGKKEAVKEKKQDAKKGMTHSTKLIIFTCVASLIYALVFEGLGYVLSTILFIGSILFVLNGKQNWKVNMVVAVCFSVGIYFIFMRLLAIPLPMLPILEI